MRIPVHRDGRVVAHTLVSEEDADLSGSTWTLHSKGYARRRSEYMHRAIAARMLGRLLAQTEQVHHGPGGKLDNRRTNLTTCVDSLAHKAQHFEHPGVRWDSTRRRWLARPTINGRKVFLGRHSTREAAIAAVMEARYATT